MGHDGDSAPVIAFDIETGRVDGAAAWIDDPKPHGALKDPAQIAADIAAFLQSGGRITEIPRGVSVESGLRCVAAEGRSGTFERRWENDTRREANAGEGLATWKGRDRILLPGTLTTPRAA